LVRSRKTTDNIINEEMRFLPCLILLIALGCKKENKIPESLYSAELTLSRTWFTHFSGITKEEKKYEHASAMFLKNVYTVPGGTVKYGDSVLNKQNLSNFYVSHNPDEEKLNFNPAWNGNKMWVISGTDSVPGFSALAASFPDFLLKEIDTMPVARKSQAFTIDWNNSIPCDSIRIGLYQGNNYFESGTITGALSSYTFYTAQLAAFDKFNPAYLILEGRTFKNIKAGNMPVKVETYAVRNFMVKIMD
jgi:hypothetical protein